MTYSPRICVAVRLYCSSASVSVPSLTTNAPPESCTITVMASNNATTNPPQCLRDANRLDLVVASDGVDDVHPLGDLTEDRVDAVEMSLRRMADEELTPARVFAGVRHR